jgi:Ca2+:H+ antiporter
MPETSILTRLERGQKATIVVAASITAAAGGATAAGVGAVTRFVLSGLALGALAAVVGMAIEQVGERTGPGATGLLQSTMGNLPELFVGLFALSDGLTTVVRAALVGSVLANAVLVLGFVFVAGGIRHGPQRFDPQTPRLNASLLLLVSAALLVPTLASKLGTPAAAHTGALSDVLAVVLLVVYAASVPYYLRDRTGVKQPAGEGNVSTWPIGMSVVVLAFGSAGAAAAADWFVGPLQSATRSLGISQTFTGLVVVAIASNAVENAVGIRFALRAKPEYAISTTLNSPLQVALLLTPALVLLSTVVGPSKLTLVFPALLVAALGISSVVVTVVIYDGEYTWIEGVALIGLYVMIATAFWWG